MYHDSVRIWDFIMCKQMHIWVDVYIRMQMHMCMQECFWVDVYIWSQVYMPKQVNI